MPPTTNIYFGTPQQGTMLMKQDISLPVHLPFCMCVQKSSPDTIVVTFRNSFEHLKHYKIIKQKTDQLFATLQSMLHLWSIKQNKLSTRLMKNRICLSKKRKYIK